MALGAGAGARLTCTNGITPLMNFFESHPVRLQMHFNELPNEARETPVLFRNRKSPTRSRKILASD